MIEVDQLGKRFGQTWAVCDLTFQVDRGEIFGLLGPNGAGKTTTMRLLGALISPSAGRGRVAGFELGRQDNAVRSSIGLLPGEPSLYDMLTAEANLDFHAQLHGLSAARRRERVRACLDLVGLWERHKTTVGSFSKGMKQRVALARALLHEPPVLLLDEPTSGLDPAVARRVRDVLAELRGRGTTIVLSTHDLEEARQLCDRVAFLRNRLLHIDTPRAISQALFGRSLHLHLANPTLELEAFVRSLPFVRELTATADGFSLKLADADLDAPALVRALVGVGADIVRLEEEQHSLEAAYLEIVEPAEAVV
jgi:ABC-2 type transport system ATP-binding protein